MTSARQSSSCFIGSSSEGLPHARALAANLKDAGIECELWNLSTFALGLTTMEGLEAAMARNSFAVFVATADDKTISRGKAKLSPRDNIIFEFGLFAGRLGRGRAFLLVPDDVPSLKLPTDLLGVTIGSFAVRRTMTAQRNSMRPAAAAIAEGVEQQGALEAPSDPAIANELLVSVSRQLADLRASARVTMSSTARKAWVQAVMAAVLEPFLVRSDDAYSEWLRPDSGEEVLKVVASTNLETGHDDHRWKRGEGLVGKAWDTGRPVAIDKLREHPWFKTRPGCENETYICVPIGKPAGPEGVLAVGSDAGFDVQAGDLGLLHAYGELLAVAIPQSRTPGS